MKISNRLKQIASFIDDGDKIIDVGCDHALLDIFLALNKKNISIIASDINPKSLEMARKNIDFYKVNNLINVKNGDGIEKIDDSTNTIVISGLGGLTIIDILKKDINKLRNIDKLIISPHSDIYKVRKYMVSIGYKIKDEVIIYDQDKPYIIIKFIKGIEHYNDEEIFLGPILLRKKDKNFLKYCQEIISKDKSILKKIPNNNYENINKIKEEIKRLDEILKV